MKRVLILALLLVLFFLALGWGGGKCYEDYGLRCRVTENSLLVSGVLFLASIIFSIRQREGVASFMRCLLWSALLYVVLGVIVIGINLFFINTEGIASWLPLLIALWPKTLLFPL